MYGCMDIYVYGWKWHWSNLPNNKNKQNNKRHEGREGTNKEKRAVEMGDWRGEVYSSQNTLGACGNWKKQLNKTLF